MEIREVTSYSDKTPFTGYGVWMVFELKYRKVLLLHPVYLTEVILREYEYVSSVGKCIWPFNETSGSFNLERFTNNFKERIKLAIVSKKSFPIQTAAKALAELQETTQEEALAYIVSLNVSTTGKPVSVTLDKVSKTFTLSKEANIENIRGRPLAIVEALKENGPANIYQIVHLVDGKLKTKCDLRRAVVYFVNKLASQGILEII